jgi:hypothetical protein
VFGEDCAAVGYAGAVVVMGLAGSGVIDGDTRLWNAGLERRWGWG